MQTNHGTKAKAKALAEAEGLTYTQALAKVRAGVSGHQNEIGESVAAAIRDAWATPGPSPADLARANQADWRAACKTLGLKGDPTKAPWMRVKAGSLVAQQVGLPEGGRVRILGVGTRGGDSVFRPLLQVEHAGNRYWVDLDNANAADVSFR